MDLKTLNGIVAGFRPAAVLHVACSLKVFTLLAGGELPLDELAGRCNAKPEMLEKLLIALIAMGLLERRGGAYRNTEFSDTWLVEGRPLYQGDIVAHSASLWDFWGGLENEILRDDAPRPASDPHRKFIMGMHNLAVTSRAKTLAEHVDLRGRRKLFDVGGGPGTYSIALCRRFPELHAVVFDLPETVAIAREVIAREGMQERVTAQPGSWDTDGFGSGNDAVLISNVLHGPNSKAEMKLRKAFDSLAAGGLLIVQDFVLNDDKTGPLIPALFNIMLGAYSRPELFALIEQAGFARPRVAATMEEAGSTVVAAQKEKTG
ncbi:MAG TPA: methyltransferase [Planctomycetota bacterium]|nr:methyltransferase [Planctomycetota bacterium]